MFLSVVGKKYTDLSKAANVTCLVFVNIESIEVFVFYVEYIFNNRIWADWLYNNNIHSSLFCLKMYYVNQIHYNTSTCKRAKCNKRN
jgi:hypothetical protein